MYKIVRAAIADPENALEEPFSFHHFRARSATDEEEIYGTNPQAASATSGARPPRSTCAASAPKRVKPLPLRKAS
jgi:hypothetical protein